MISKIKWISKLIIPKILFNKTLIKNFVLLTGKFFNRTKADTGGLVENTKVMR